MSVTQALMGQSEFTIPLRPGTPRSFLNDIAIDDNLWATIAICPQHLSYADLGANIDGQVRFAGVYLEQDGDSLKGEGHEWWLGNSGDGGSLSVGVDATHTGRDFEDHLDNDVFGASNAISNNLSKGTVSTDATTFSFKEEGGDTPREILDTLCAIAPGGPYSWRINPTGTIDAHTAATLWPTTTTPTVILADQGGREGAIDALEASLTLQGRNGREVRTGVYVDWQDGTDNGLASLTIPARWTTITGGTPRVRHYMDWRPKRPKPPTERWRKVAAWRIASQTRANGLAARELNERETIRKEITAEVDVYDPHRFDITPGNRVYLWDQEQDLVDTSNEVYYWGEVAHPTTSRVDVMDWPILEGYGVYLLRWVSSSLDIVDLTPWVDFEEGPTVLQMGTRDRFPVARVTASTLTRRDRRRIRRKSHKEAKLDKFYHSGFFK